MACIFTHCNTSSWRLRSFPRCVDRSCINWTWKKISGGRQMRCCWNKHVSTRGVASSLLLSSKDDPKSMLSAELCGASSLSNCRVLLCCCCVVECSELIMGTDTLHGMLLNAQTCCWNVNHWETEFISSWYRFVCTTGLVVIDGLGAPRQWCKRCIVSERPGRKAPRPQIGQGGADIVNRDNMRSVIVCLRTEESMYICHTGWNKTDHSFRSEIRRNSYIEIGNSIEFIFMDVFVNHLSQNLKKEIIHSNSTVWSCTYVTQAETRLIILSDRKYEGICILK
jgi:hypothetical protein